jgi:hypothetical protein
MLGADLDGRRPRLRLRFERRQHGHVIAARQRPSPAARRRPGVQHDCRSRRPTLAADRRRVTCMHHSDAGGCRHPVQLGAHVGLGQDRQHTRGTRRINSGAASHPTTVRGRDLGTTVPNADLWIETRVCTKASGGTPPATADTVSRNAPRAGLGAVHRED